MMSKKIGTLTFYGKYAFRTEGASVTCCVKSLQLLRKQIKSPFLKVFFSLKNIVELKKYWRLINPRKKMGLATYLIR